MPLDEPVVLRNPRLLVADPRSCDSRASENALGRVDPKHLLQLRIRTRLAVIFGLIVLGVVYVWLIYRVVKGFLKLTEGRPVFPA